MSDLIVTVELNFFRCPNWTVTTCWQTESRAETNQGGWIIFSHVSSRSAECLFVQHLSRKDYNHTADTPRATDRAPEEIQTESCVKWGSWCHSGQITASKVNQWFEQEWRRPPISGAEIFDGDISRMEDWFSPVQTPNMVQNTKGPQTSGPEPPETTSRGISWTLMKVWAPTCLKGQRRFWRCSCRPQCVGVSLCLSCWLLSPVQVGSSFSCWTFSDHEF